jgi:hypothetical protein
MDSKTYNAAVLTTESKPETIRFGTIGTHAVLGLIHQTGELVDVAKKSMFYGKPFDRLKFAEDASVLAGLCETLRQSALDGDLTNPQDIKAFDSLPEHIAGLDLNNSLNRRLLHVVMGTSSESAEIANELRLAWEEKRPVDRVNMSEEIGDHLWYLAVGADELGIPLSVVFQQNITKLTDKKDGRYREGTFDVDGAINRNLEAERANLESSLVKPTVNDEQELIGTPDSHVYYDRNKQEFVWFDEAGLEGGRANNFGAAVAYLESYCDQLSSVHCTGHVHHTPESRNAGEMSIHQASRIANSIEGANAAHDRVPLERFGSPVNRVEPGKPIPRVEGALERMGSLAKVAAVGVLDAVDTGVDKAKAYLGRQ